MVAVQMLRPGLCLAIPTKQWGVGVRIAIDKRWGYATMKFQNNH